MTKGRPILAENAFAVSDNYTILNAPNTPYSNLIPPQIVETQIVDVPALTQVREQTLSTMLPAHPSEVLFNAYQHPLNNASEWATHFPAGGTAEQPTVVRVTSWGLNIPDNVTIENTIIIVENGYVNFNGSGHVLNNVVLIADNGGINLNNVQATNLSVIASQAINMNGSARFAGSSLIAFGDQNGLNFNGATTSTTAADLLTVISQGRITFNAAAATRGTFISAGDFTINSNSSLIGSIQSKRNIIFNAQASVTKG